MEQLDNEIKKFDCSRGCVVERNDEGELDCSYRQGCCKLEVYDWLSGVRQEQYKDYFEVRFKNTRKGRFLAGVRPGFKRFTPSLVIRDQLLCLPLPLIPWKGFS